MNEIMNFEHKAFGQVRTLVKDGEPWFIAKDVAEILGYSRPNDAISAHCKAYQDFRISTVKRRGNPNVKIIPERDVYRLIMRSKLPLAEMFEEWVVGEVLPAIRKHGGYVHATTEETSEEIMARALLVAQQTIKRVEDEKARAEAQIEAN